MKVFDAACILEKCKRRADYSVMLLQISRQSHYGHIWFILYSLLDD
jgi:hypothetical protein